MTDKPEFFEYESDGHMRRSCEAQKLHGELIAAGLVQSFVFTDDHKHYEDGVFKDQVAP